MFMFISQTGKGKFLHLKIRECEWEFLRPGVGAYIDMINSDLYTDQFLFLINHYKDNASVFLCSHVNRRRTGVLLPAFPPF